VLVFTEGLPIAHQSRPWPLWHFPGAALVHIGAQALLALLAPLIPTALHQLQLVASALDSGHCSIPKDHSLRGQTQDSFGTARSRWVPAAGLQHHLSDHACCFLGVVISTGWRLLSSSLTWHSHGLQPLRPLGFWVGGGEIFWCY